MFQSILNALFPSRCVSCGSMTAGSGYHYLCGQCAGTVKPRAGLPEGCRVCGAEMPAGNESVCYRCSVTSYRFRKNRSVLNYREPAVRELTHLFKFGSNRLAGQDLSLLLREGLAAGIRSADCDMTVATPLSKSAMRKRGFNQVERVLDLCGLSYVPLLSREGHPGHQSDLNALDRKEAVKGQFRIKREYANSIPGKKILIIDDVYTTGSTADEMSGILLDGGALSVDVLTFFRD